MRPKRERGEMLYKNMRNWKRCRQRTCIEKYNWYLKYMIYVVWAQPSIEDQWIDSGMVAAIQWTSHVIIMIIYKIAAWILTDKIQGLALHLDPNKSTSSNMRIQELKSNMHEHRLITSQWWKMLTDARGTTNNDNGPQGTIGTIYGVRISELSSNTCRIIWSEANDENLTSNTKNLPLRHAGSKAPEMSL